MARTTAKKQVTPPAAEEPQATDETAAAEVVEAVTEPASPPAAEEPQAAPPAPEPTPKSTCRHAVMRPAWVGPKKSRRMVKRCDDCGFERELTSDSRPLKAGM